MSEVLRFGVSIESELLENFDELVARQGYATRSESLRDLIRDALVRSRLEGPDEAADVLGSLTLVYDHHAHELTEQMAELQHDHHGLVVSVLHVHVSQDDCMEVIVLRGPASEVRTLADTLLSLKGVKHGRLFVTLASRQIAERAGGHAHSHTRAQPRARAQGTGARER
ncbi:MAG: nickel-responsive transcriptional regulator NikR [Pyrinomonadaceae bacterium]